MTQATSVKRIVVGISGASGIRYGIRILEVLRTLGVETHLVVTKAAEQTRALETNVSSRALGAMATFKYSVTDISAPIASGSFRNLGMIVAPCSMRTLAEIASGVTSSLLSRAADVVLKERRKLVLVVREAPLSSIHLRNMLTVSDAGAVVIPPVVGFYSKPKTLDDVVDHHVARILDQFDIEMPGARRWGDRVASPDRGSDGHPRSSPSDVQAEERYQTAVWP